METLKIKVLLSAIKNKSLSKTVVKQFIKHIKTRSGELK